MFVKILNCKDSSTAKAALIRLQKFQAFQKPYFTYVFATAKCRKTVDSLTSSTVHAIPFSGFTPTIDKEPKYKNNKTPLETSRGVIVYYIPNLI
jgi:hypothetical protein